MWQGNPEFAITCRIFWQEVNLSSADISITVPSVKTNTFVCILLLLSKWKFTYSFLILLRRILDDLAVSEWLLLRRILDDMAVSEWLLLRRILDDMAVSEWLLLNAHWRIYIPIRWWCLLYTSTTILVGFL
jgi:hypothetical protein